MRLLTTTLLSSLIACQSPNPACSANGLRQPAVAAAALLRLVEHPTDATCAYVSAAGGTVMPLGRYLFGPEWFDKVAFLLKSDVGWVSINK